MPRGRRSAPCVLALALALGPMPLAAAPQGGLDDGLLELDWFSLTPSGGEPTFRETADIDYLWVRDGFDIEGHTFHFLPWPEPELLDSGRDTNDYRLGRQLAGEMHRMLHDATSEYWDGMAASSLQAGDVRVEGRIVDCSTGSVAAKALVGFGAGAGNTTFDVKFVDAESGELLAAMHQRVVSGTNWSTTDSKLGNWLEEWAESVAKRGLGPLYAKGKPVRE